MLKGHLAIIKFSDKTREFELFLFSEMLVKNREKLKESEAFVLTLQKEKTSGDVGRMRLNVKKLYKNSYPVINLKRRRLRK